MTARADRARTFRRVSFCAPVTGMLAFLPALGLPQTDPSAAPSAVPSSPAAFATMVYPLEGAKLPPLAQTFVLGAVPAGSTLTINGAAVPVHATGGYLTMVPLQPGETLLRVEALTPQGQTARLDRRFTVAAPFTPSPESPFTFDKATLTPAEDLWLAPGDTLRVAFQGSPLGTAEFAIEEGAKHIPMIESPPGRGLYEGAYVIQPDDRAQRASIEVTFKKKRDTRKEKAKGRLSVDAGAIPRMGLITEDVVAARPGPDGGYDLFLFKGMRVQLTGKIAGQWRARLSSIQSGWLKETSVQELPRGTPPAQSAVPNMTVTHEGESTVVRIPLADVLPYRIEQTVDPNQLRVTLYGAVNKTDLIRYDPVDPLVRRVRWRQLSPDTCQIFVDPAFKTWWGYDVRYEGTTLLIEIRKPWTDKTLRGMVIAVDAGHGGSDLGAMGPRGLLEKDANLQIARAVADALAKAGAKPVLVRERDVDVPLYERPRIAWRSKARLFVSVHGNSAGPAENPLWTNGSSVYFYQPQSQELAKAVHAGFRKHVARLPDRGLFYADFAVCRMTPMPSVLVENAYMIVPEQEELLFDPRFQRNFANAIVNGIKTFVLAL